MADMVATMGLDETEFRRGLQRMEAMSRSETSRIQGHFERMHAGFARAFRMGTAMLAFRQSISIIGDLMRDYAQRNDEAAASLDRLSASASSAFLPIQRGLDLLGRAGSGNQADQFIKGFTGGLGGSINFVSDLISGEQGNAQMADQNAALEEQITLIRKRQEEWTRLKVDLNTSFFQSSGQDVFAEIETEKERHRRVLEQIKAMREQFGLNNSDNNILLSSANATHQNRLRQINETAHKRAFEEASGMGDEAVERFRAQQKADEQSRAANFALDIGEKQAQMEIKRLQGKEQEVALDRIRLDLAVQLREIENQQSLSQEQKAQRVAQARELAGQLQRATIADFVARAELDAVEPERVFGQRRSLGGGAAGISGLHQQVFGRGTIKEGSGDKQLEVAKNTSESARTIERFVIRAVQILEGGFTAVAG